MQLKHPQIPRARNQIPKQPAFPRPPGELDEIRRVLPRRQLRPIPAHPLLEQEPVEHPHQLEPLINDRPVPHPRRQINTLPLEKADQDQPQHHNPRTPPRTPTPDAPGGAERRAPPDRRFPVALRTPAQRRPGGTHHPTRSNTTHRTARANSHDLNTTHPHPRKTTPPSATAAPHQHRTTPQPHQKASASPTSRPTAAAAPTSSSVSSNRTATTRSKRWSPTTWTRPAARRRSHGRLALHGRSQREPGRWRR